LFNHFDFRLYLSTPYDTTLNKISYLLTEVANFLFLDAFRWCNSQSTDCQIVRLAFSLMVLFREIGVGAGAEGRVFLSKGV